MSFVAVISYIVKETGMLSPVKNVVFDWNDSSFLTFSGDDEFVFVPVNIIEFEVAELADTHTCVCKKINDGFRSLARSASIAATKNEVDVLCCWCFNWFFVGFVRGEYVGDIAELAPGIEGFDVMVELEPLLFRFLYVSQSSHRHDLD
jgi:hypothetical protein